ncbi:MAG: hypothetical protein WCF30_06675 [Terracidiphilus sp.]
MNGSQKLGMAVQNVLDTLQRRPETPERKRVRRIVDLLMRLQKSDENDPTQSVDFIRDNDELDALLSAYRWEAAAIFTDKLRISFQPKGGSGREGSAISVLVRLAESEQLGRLRACKACQRLFYAFRNDKRVCGANCKAKDYDADPEHHAARLKRLRENYALRSQRKRKKIGTRRG